MTPFDVIKHITTGEKLPEDFTLSLYSPFVVNRGLSFYWDTCLVANELNIKTGIPKEAQLIFLNQIVSKRKRWSKWHKEKKSAKIKVLQELYGYSTLKSKEALSVLTPEEFLEVKRLLPKTGGLVKGRK